ncbi:MAG TPA: hypothetical protein VGU22_13175 [Methylomirabilota bacterium]|jgi:hypothetical protein|nr:hypothetical protein [Methylomirabilota bacterium]
MSSNGAALLSATFHEAGHDHLVELVHQRDAAARRHLASLRLDVYDGAGRRVDRRDVDPRAEIVDLDALVGDLSRAHGRVMVVFDARYDPRVFPYRPHHYAYLHRRGSAAPPLYYAVNATLGGVPDRIGAVALNNFESYLFLERTLAERYALVLGNLSRFAQAEAQVFSYYGGERRARDVALAPKQHVEVALAAEDGGRRLQRVEVKAVFRLTSYVTARAAAGDDLVLFDHLFTYFK